ncbi:MAG TPA: HDOD domain-containing protein [Telluria sp.]
MHRLEAFRNIAAQASRGELAFPTHVNAALKLQDALGDPGCRIDAATRLVQAEPLLAARTVAIANSAAYNRAGHEVTSVKSAVQRVGFRTLNALVASVIVRQLNSAVRDPGLREMSNRLWEHSAHVAALSMVIARRVTRVDPETALFAGIVHEIGGFYLLSRAEEYPGLLEGEADEWIEHGEVEVGRAVLLKLGVPHQVLDAIEAMWAGIRVLPPATLGDTLMLANDLSPVPSPLHQHPDATSHQAAVTIDFTHGNGTLAGILDESAGEVRSLTEALR